MDELGLVYICKHFGGGFAVLLHYADVVDRVQRVATLVLERLYLLHSQAGRIQEVELVLPV